MDGETVSCLPKTSGVGLKGGDRPEVRRNSLMLHQQHTRQAKLVELSLSGGKP